VRLALMARTGEMGYPVALSAKTWGFYDVLFKGQPFKFTQGYGSYVMENVLFKISFPAEFHAQTAVECAVKLHPEVGHRINDIKKVVITTHESAIRIIDKSGPLANPADRDHCIQYMTAIGLMKGNLTAADYEDEVARDPRVDALRAKMECVEHKPWTRDYLDPKKRSIANAVQVFFKDGSKTANVAVEYPIGHRRRRKDGIPLLEAKFRVNLGRKFAEKRRAAIYELCKNQKALEATPVHEFVDLFAI
jgi:2-methylcitrate dehydratase